MKKRRVPSKLSTVSVIVEVEQIDPEDIPPPTDEFIAFFRKVRSSGRVDEDLLLFQEATKKHYAG